MGLGGLHMLGAIGAGEGLKNQTITLRVLQVDKDRLKQKLAESGQSAAITPLAMTAVDYAPKALFDMAIPLVRKQILDYGVKAEIQVLDTPQAGSPRPRSEFWVGGGIGATVAAILIGVGWGGFKAVKWLV